MCKCCSAWHSGFRMSLSPSVSHVDTRSMGAHHARRVEEPRALWASLISARVLPFPLAAPAPAGCWACTLAELCFCPGTNRRQLLLRRQPGYKPGTWTSLKGQVIPSAFPGPHLSVQEWCGAGLSGSWDQTMLSSISPGSNARGMYHPPEISVLGADSPRMAAPWNLSVSQHLRISGC